jgi:hypothetical protein
MTTVGLCMMPFVDILAQFFSSDLDAQWNIKVYVYINIICTPFTVAGLVVNGIMVGVCFDYQSYLCVVYSPAAGDFTGTYIRIWFHRGLCGDAFLHGYPINRYVSCFSQSKLDKIYITKSIKIH